MAQLNSTNILGNLSITGNSCIGGTSTIHGAFTANNSSTFKGSITGQTTLTVAGVGQVGNTFTIKNASGGDAALIFDRAQNANWKIVDSNGDLHFQCDYTTGKTSYYNIMILAHNTKIATFIGQVKADTLKITNTNATKHLEFSRGNYNYITAPASGIIGFVVNGQNINDTTCDLTIKDGSVFPGTTKATDLGQSAKEWNTIYANNIILSSTTNGSQTAAGNPALRIGNSDSTIHLIIDRDAIGAKATSTTAGTLNINESGGLVKIGSGGIESGGKILAKASQSNSNNAHVALIEAQNTIADPGVNFFASMTMMSPNLTRANTANIFLFGKSRSSKNSGYIGYTWAADASNSNYITIGHYGVDNIMAISGAGNVGIGTTAPSTKLHVVGTGNFTSNLNGQTVSVDSKVKFQYNSTDDCLDIIFI